MSVNIVMWVIHELRRLGYCVVCKKRTANGKCDCQANRIRLLADNPIQDRWKKHGGLWLPGEYVC